MQSNGYKRLWMTEQLLAEISANELSDAESWSQRIEQLADGDRKSGRVSFLSQRVGLMIGILGNPLTQKRDSARFPVAVC